MIIEFAHDPRETRSQKKADELFFQELLLVVMVHFCQMWEWFWLFLGH